MPSSIPHEKICFYHLPTQRRAGIKLADAWYVSNVSIIFDCSMLYYILFWTLLGFTIHFYIIFGTNLLTGGPAQNCYFSPISEFRRKRISNGVQTEWNLRERDFRNERDTEDLDPTSRHQPGGHEVSYTHHIPSSKQPPYLPIMAFPLPFRDILPCNLPPFRLLWHTPSLSYCFAWSCSWHCICGKATIHNYFIHVTLDSLHIPVHRRRHSHRVMFCSKYWVVIHEL